MYKQLYLNSEKKRDKLIKDVSVILKGIDKEKDESAFEKAKEFLETIKEKYGKVQPGGSENTSKI